MQRVLVVACLLCLSACSEDDGAGVFESCAEGEGCADDMACWLGISDDEGVCLPSSGAEMGAACADGQGVTVLLGLEYACFPSCDTLADCKAFSSAWNDCDYAEVVSSSSSGFAYGMTKVCAPTLSNALRGGEGQFCGTDGSCGSGLCCQGDALCLPCP